MWRFGGSRCWFCVVHITSEGHVELTGRGITDLPYTVAYRMPMSTRLLRIVDTSELSASGVTSKPASWGHLKTGQFVDHHPGQELVLPCLLLFWQVWLCSTWFQSSPSRIGR